MPTTTKMVSKNGDNLMINTRLMKITGLYYLLDSRGPKIFFHNILKCISLVEISFMLIMIVIIIANIYYFSDDINAVMHYLILLTCDMLTAVKIYVIFVKSDTIWNCIQMTSIDNLSYKYHDRRILKNGQMKSKLYSLLSVIFWGNLLLSWGLLPLFVTNYFLELDVENKIYRYRFNIMNFVYPVTDQFYNDNFMTYYYIEYICLCVWFHSTMNFEILFVSMSITFKYQLKNIANSFSTFNITNYINNNLTKNVKHQRESELLFDFKRIIYDQQRVIENMRIIYRIFQPVIFSQLASNTLIIILLSCITMINFFNGISLISAMNLRLLSALLTTTFHIYIICYLFEDVYQQKDSINFALYGSDWTQSNAQHKLLILHTMRLNDAENLRLQVTRNRIVNFQMFADIMRTTYSILSVLGKMCAEKA